MITSERAERIGAESVRVIATSDLPSPIFRWYLDGRFFVEELAGFIDLPSNRQRVVEVFDQDTPTPILAGLSGVVEVTWERTAGAVGYAVQVYDGAAWQTVEELEAVGGQRSYSVNAQAEDETILQTRVVGRMASGVEAVVMARQELVVRVPDEPVVALSVEDGELVAE
jgi:hypothetical protein